MGRSLGERPPRHHDRGRRALWRDRRWRHRRRRRAHRLGRSTADLPGAPEKLARHVHDLAGAWLTPGLIDCHTHLVYGGDRAQEFELRLQGATYEEIARAGGGIRSTVAQTRAASEDDLVASAQSRVDAFRREGVTTLEVKSGYGLDAANEAKMLRAARRLTRA